MILDVGIFQIMFIVLSFNLKDSIEKSTMFVINLWHFYSEALVPSVRIRNWENDPCRGVANSQKEKGQFGHHKIGDDSGKFPAKALDEEL